MNYRVVVVVVACIALAGCAGLIDGNSGTGTPVPDTNSVSYPGSFTANGTANATAAVRAHEAQLLEHSNYSVTWQFLEGNDETVVRNTTIDGAVSPAEDRLLYSIAQRAPGGNVTGYHREAYFADGRNRVYSFAEDSLAGERRTNLSSLVFPYGDSILTLLHAVDLEATSVDRVDDATVITYDVTGLSDQGAEHFDEANGTVRITTDGRFVSVNVRTVAGDDVRTTRYAVSDVGRTTVERPDWLEETE